MKEEAEEGASEEGLGLAEVCDERGLFYCVGQRAQSQLALPQREGEGNVVPEPVLNWSLRGHNVVMADCGYAHTLLLTAEGLVFGFGANHFGQCMPGGPDVVGSPHRLRGWWPEPASLVSCGMQYCAVISQGKVWTWGMCSHSCLGRAGKEERPTLVDGGGLGEQEVLQVACGNDHVLALTEGQVWAWGRGTEGQLGYGLDLLFDVCSPRPLKSFPDGAAKPVSVDAGTNFSLALMEDGRVYCWGDGTYGATGHLAFAPVPTLLKALVAMHIVYVSAGWTHAMAIDQDNVLYTWGSNKYGQLGLGHTDNMRVPTRVGGELGSRAVTGVRGGMRHTLALTREGDVFCWGTNSYGQLGVHVEDAEAQEEEEVVPEDQLMLLPARQEADKVVAEFEDMRPSKPAQANAQLLPRLMLGSSLGHAPCHVIVTGGEHSMAWVLPYPLRPLPTALRSLVGSPRFADVLCVPHEANADITMSQCLWAHSVLLGFRVRKLKPWLLQRWKPGQPVVLRLPQGTSMATWALLVEFLYTGTVLLLSPESCEPLAREGQRWASGEPWAQRLQALCSSTSCDPPATASATASAALQLPPPSLLVSLSQCFHSPDFSDVMVSVGDDLLDLNKVLLWARGGPALATAMRLELTDASFPGPQALQGALSSALCPLDDSASHGTSAAATKRVEEEEEDKKEGNDSSSSSDGDDLDVIVVESVSSQVFKGMMDWMYLDRGDFEPDLALRMLEPAGKYGLQALVDRCTAIISSSGMLGPGNAPFFLELGRRFKASALKRSCQALVLQHWDMFEETRWAGFHPDSLTELRFIKFGPDMEEEEEETTASRGSRLADTVAALKGRLLGKFAGLRLRGKK